MFAAIASQVKFGQYEFHSAQSMGRLGVDYRLSGKARYSQTQIVLGVPSAFDEITRS